MKKVILLCSLFLLCGASQVMAQTFTPKLTLTWEDRSSNEVGFAIERGTVQAGPFTEIATVPANVVTHVDTTVSTATVYCYRLRAYNERTVNSQVEKQYSGYSNVACGSSMPKPDGDPTNLLLSAQESIGSAQELLGNATAQIARALQQH